MQVKELLLSKSQILERQGWTNKAIEIFFSESGSNESKP